ncbi:MAG TPA: alpha/beta fold hydrolase [Gaiellaceae bacterium]|nr:alpha/beta fold hydrolase [Gaiellaceae bacterium]
METPATRTYTPARVVALALVALAIAGLAYLRFASDAGPVSVPAGAQAGDLILDNCDYATENGSYAAECGTLVVPENRADPGSRLIALPITRIKARSESPAEPIFRLEGGPGKTNMDFANASRFADDHDVVLVGYRGVDGSVRLDCPEVSSALGHSKDFLGEASFRAYGDAYRACADRLTDDGADLAGYGLVQQVDDLEAARKAFGYEKIDLLSESAGTRTAMIYAWRYPESIHRSVMLAVNPPGGFLWDGKATDEQLARYAELCSQDASCSERTDDLVASMKRTGADLPDRWAFLPIKDANVRIASFYGLVESGSDAAPISAPMTLGSWLAADDGDASGFWLQSLLADMVFPKSFVWGQMAAAARIDAQAAAESFSSGSRKPGSNLGDAATAFIWGNGALAESWPAVNGEDEYDRVRTSDVETLLIGGELDFATPPQAATEELLPHLPNGRQVVLPGFGHSGTFWSEQPEAGTHLITTYLATGEVDDSRYEPQAVDFTPEVTQTALGKGISGGMVGLAALTALSLLWMAVRVSARGGYGRKTSAVLRSLWAPVLGLGGWLAGVLVVTTTMPGVPLDDELLAALSVGLPVGLGIYLAWTSREKPAETKAIGFAAALAGALAGAWLGFHATENLLALLTAIGGSVAGANLTLILLDISRARPRTAQQDESVLPAPASLPTA